MSLVSLAMSYHADFTFFYNPPPWPPPTPSRIQQISSYLTERIDLRHDHPDYIHPVPNLELHSAAASGNVGLVHYALTHGQPVNSVLHGVLPLHAACSGGSVDVVKMLIERGANVNAPRLPRRYSDGRKSNAPSVGTAGTYRPLRREGNYKSSRGCHTDWNHRLDTFAFRRCQWSRSYRSNPTCMRGGT